ncbi:MAG: endolytic transglycosylase MltG, partial [Solobacterium sp.]|nr:endolytic transglycosylase MltG [Solobacterium sp.]
MSEDKTEIIETDELYDLTDDFDDEDEHKFPLFLKIIGILVLLFLCVLGGGYYYYMNCQKAIQKDSEIVMVEIPENSYFRDALDILEKEGLIKDANIAYYYARFNHLTNTFAGNYELDKSMDLKEILTILNNPTSAKQETHTVKIIDGEWCKNIAESLAEVTGIAEEEFTTLWNDKEWIRSQMEEYPFLTEAIFENPDSRFYLEGYLAPDTYLVLKDASAEEITKTFLDQ